MNEPSFKYSIRSTLPGHPDSPASIGARFLRTLDCLSKIDPSIFTRWEVMDFPAKDAVPLASARLRIGTMIADNVARDDCGKPSQYYGYSAMAYTGGSDKSRFVSLWIKAGGRHAGHIWLQTGFWQVPADPAIVTFPIYRAALLAIVANWPLPWISAHAFRSNYAMVPVHGGAGQLLERRPMLPQQPTFPDSPFHIPWIGYLSAALAAGVKLTSEITTERTPDGGLLIIVTEDRLDPENPEHLRRARIVAETMIACTGYEPGGRTRT